MLIRILSTKFGLMALGAAVSLFTAVGIVSGQVVASAPDNLIAPVTGRESAIASVVELVWTTHLLAIGILLFAVGLLAPNPFRARIGTVGVVALLGSQIIAVILAGNYGYDGMSDSDPSLEGPIIFVCSIFTLIACLSKWNAR